jgi:predicted hydrocarbon binding protein
VVVTYTSARQLCALGRGIIRGLAREYKERVTIDEPVCMLRGADTCEIHVRVANEDFDRPVPDLGQVGQNVGK